MLIYPNEIISFFGSNEIISLGLTNSFAMIISSILQLVLHENELGLAAPSGLLRLIPSHRGIEGDWKALLRGFLTCRAFNPSQPL